MKFFTIKKILEAKSPLNLVEEGSMSGLYTGDLCKFSEDLLVSIAEIFFTHLLPEGEIDYQKLDQSDDFKKFLINSSKLHLVNTFFFVVYF